MIDNMIDFLGSGALNLDLVYEVDNLEDVRSAGFDLHPGHEISAVWVTGPASSVQQVKTGQGILY